MPRVRRTLGGAGLCASRASSSFSDEEVKAMMRLFAEIDTGGVRAVIGKSVHVNKVRRKFIMMRASILAAQACKRAVEGEAAQ